MTTTTLSSLEHELIVSYLAEEHVILNIIFSQSAREESKDEAVQIRLETGKKGVSVSKNGVITIQNPSKEIKANQGKTVTVVFYFRKLGLSFSAVIEKPDAHFELTVPRNISRLSETKSAQKPVTANLYFSLSGKKDVSFLCEVVDSFPLFKPEVWQTIKQKNVLAAAKALKTCLPVSIVQIPADVFARLKKTGRLLYKPNDILLQKKFFDFDLCATKEELNSKNAQLDFSALPYSLYMPIDNEHSLCAAMGSASITQEEIEHLLAAVSACSYSSSSEDVLLPIEDRVMPLAMIFLSDRYVVLGGKTENFALKKGQEYAIQISCAIPAGKRVIHSTLAVSEVITSPDATHCAAVCVFTGIMAEDRRFLFEKLYGTIFR